MPSGITLERDAGGIRISWPAVTDAASYSVFRSVNGQPYGRIATVPAANIFYTDTDISPGTDYDYKVSAAQAYLGEGPQSSPICATTKAVPHPYIQMTVTGTGVELSWNPIFRAAEYRVYESSTGGADLGTLVPPPLIATQCSYSSASAYYRVAAVNFAGDYSEFSGYVSALITGVVLTRPPLTPLMLPWAVDISWTAVEGVIYNLYRATLPTGPFTLVRSGISGSDLPYTSYASSVTTYYYKVASVYAGSGVGQSDTIFGPFETSYPSPPARVTAEPGGSPGTVEISWIAVSGITYNIYRETSSSGPFTTPLITSVPASPYPDSGIPGVTYYYKVSAVSGSFVEGSQSAVSSAVAPP
jgi:fibronectin type 3 domain-containing protein